MSSSGMSVFIGPKTEIDILIHGGKDRVYSNSDVIEGHLGLNFERDAAIRKVSFTLEGSTATLVENVADNVPANGRIRGKHTFLMVQHPVGLGYLPNNSLARADTPFKIPFTFVVPKRILSPTCSHATDSYHVKEAHLLLPPSLEGTQDLAPDTVKVMYAIHAEVEYQYSDAVFAERRNKSINIRMVPVRDEEPPLTINEGGSDYSLHREKSVRTSLLKKTGQLAVEASQPQALRGGIQPTKLVASRTNLKFRYDPVEHCGPPPQLNTIVSKLKCFTVYGAVPLERLAEPSREYKGSQLHGVHSEYIELSSQNISTVKWTKHNFEARARPKDASTNTESYAYRPELPYLTTSVVVPITLPTQNGIKGAVRFAPSFHSCLVSRCYAVELNISFNSPNGKARSSMVLTVPVQIMAEGHKEATPATAPEAPTGQSLSTIQPDPISDEQSLEAALEEGPPGYTPRSTRGTSSMVDRQLVCTTYELKPQEWQNIGTGIKWVFKKVQFRKHGKRQECL